MKIFTDNVRFLRGPVPRWFFFSVVFCFLAVVPVNVFDGDSDFLPLKSSGISKALSCRVGAAVKIKTDHPLAVAVNRPSLVTFHLTALPGAGDPSNRPFSCPFTPYANRAPPFLS